MGPTNPQNRASPSDVGDLTITELNGANCKTYLLACDERAALIDPVRERVEAYRRELQSRGLVLDFVIDTHTHADHRMLDRSGKIELGGVLVMHENSPIPHVDRHVADGDRLQLGPLAIEVLHTPGHTPDSICLRVPGAVFTGDTLFIGGSGRTDFPGGDAGLQYDAVVTRLFALPEQTVVWPGHDYRGSTSSTIGHEKRTNPRFSGRTRAEYVELMGNLGLPFPDRIQDVLQVNQSGFEASEVAFPRVAEIARVQPLTPAQLAERLGAKCDVLVLDVREPEEFVGPIGHIRGAQLVPLDMLERRLPKLAGYIDQDVVVVCRAGARSATAAAMLQRAGFSRVHNLSGGMLAWVAAALPIQH